MVALGPKTLTAAVMLILILLVSFLALAYVIRNRDLSASATRHDLCVAINQTNAASRHLWLRVLARAHNPDPDAVEQFKHDLFEFFPDRPCK